jgi:hypothetical protein
MKSKWIEHNEKKIFFCNYAGFMLNYAGLKAEVEQATEMITMQPGGSVLLLVDVRETPGTPENTECLKTSAVRCKPHVLKTAVVGVEGYRKMIMRTIGRLSGMALMPFDDMEGAKDWLAE